MRKQKIQRINSFFFSLHLPTEIEITNGETLEAIMVLIVDKYGAVVTEDTTTEVSMQCDTGLTTETFNWAHVVNGAFSFTFKHPIQVTTPKTYRVQVSGRIPEAPTSQSLSARRRGRTQNWPKVEFEPVVIDIVVKPGKFPQLIRLTQGSFKMIAGEQVPAILVRDKNNWIYSIVFQNLLE